MPRLDFPTPACGACSVSFGRVPSSGSAAPPVPPVGVAIAQQDEADQEQMSRYTGSVTANRQVDVSFQEGGYIDADPAGAWFRTARGDWSRKATRCRQAQRWRRYA